MRKRVRRIAVGAATLLGAWAGAGDARAGALRTYTFQGTVHRVDNSTGYFDPSIQPGSPFKLNVSLPDDTPNTLPGNTSYGHYALPTGTPGLGETLTINGQPYPLGTPTGGEVAVIAAPGQGGAFYGYQTFGSTDPNVNSLRLDFNLSSSGHPFATDALPTELNLADFNASPPSIYLPVFYNDNRAYPGVQGTINSVTVTVAAVPEPGSALVFGVAAAVFGWWRRRR